MARAAAADLAARKSEEVSVERVANHTRKTRRERQTFAAMKNANGRRKSKKLKLSLSGWQKSRKDGSLLIGQTRGTKPKSKQRVIKRRIRRPRLPRRPPIMKTTERRVVGTNWRPHD